MLSTNFKRNKISFILWGVAMFILTACVAPPESATGAQPISDAAQSASAEAVENMRGLLARQLHIDPTTIEVVSVEAVEWPDACLGLMRPTELCAPTAMPGHKMTFRVGGQEYTFHTDREGYRSRIAAAPEPAVGEMLMAWGGTFDNGECMEAIIGAEGVAFGMCGGQPKISGQFASDARLAVLNEWVTAYAAFDAETDFGSVRLMGNGTAAAPEKEVQIMGRWAQMVAMEAAAGESRAGMSYQGPSEMGSPNTSKCAMLQIGTPTTVGLGACDGSMRDLELGERAYAEWVDLRNRLAPFVYETETEKVIFEGMGNLSGAAWQRAVLAWARARHAELATGQSSATVNTALSWYLGQDTSQKNICMHLTVLDYGYAYAQEFLCEGQDQVHSYGGWLSDADLALFDQWLYDRAPLYSDQNYIDGKGSQEMSEAEIAEVNNWAMALWMRLKREGSALDLGNAANSCPEAQEGLAMLRDYQRGFCLLIPASHTVFDTNPTEVAIVKDSLLNVTEPRLYIAVIPAEGRSAEEIAGEILAVVTGIDIQTSTTEIAGQPAVVIDNLPGQDINRRVLIVYNDRLYDLTFAPMDNPEIETFYDAIVANFVLIEPE